jgi:2-polyprenyl-3-methyl-5-hydroxy-6-metoxy-1,4-benzoquinol methylase
LKKLIIDNLPFFIGTIANPNLHESHGLPSKLPFKLIFDSEQKIITQEYSEYINEQLNKSYLIGSNISANLGTGTFGERRANDVLKNIKLALNNKITDKSFLEIGCADGYILEQLVKLGAQKAIGCEPNQSNINRKNKNGVKIINDFYTPEKVQSQFDVIISLGVLEHINNPKSFIKAEIKSLKKKGTLFFSVPNCENKLLLGDLKLLQHEHWNYFTRNSLINLLLECGLKKIETRISLNDANIFAWGTFDNSLTTLDNQMSDSDKELYINFIRKVKISTKIMIDRCNQNLKEGKSMGFMSGGLELMSILPPIKNPRFFDNDSSKHGKYFSNYNNPIENPLNIKKNPVDDLWICATDYNDEIILGLNDIIPDDLSIFSIKDLLSSI